MDSSMAVSATDVWLQRLLVNRNFALLWCGQAVSLLGDFVFITTLILWIATRIAPGMSWAPLAVSGALLTTSVLTVTVGPAAGVFADRWNKRQTMMRMDIVRLCLIGMLPWLSGLVPFPLVGAVRASVGAQIGIIYAVVAGAAAASQFFMGSRTALLADIVPQAERPRASSLTQITLSFAIILGPPIAAVLVTRVGVEWALWLNAASFGVSWLSLRSVRAASAAPADSDRTPANFRREFVEGVQYVRDNRILRTITIAVMVAMLGGGALNALDVFFVRQNLHAPAATLGLLDAAYGIGALGGGLLGAVFAGRIGAARLLWVSIAALGVMLVVYARLTSLGPATVLLLLAGVPQAGLSISIGPLMMGASPREMLGRVASIVAPLTELASMISVALAGLLASSILRNFHAEILGVRLGTVDTIFMAAGVLVLASGLWTRANLSDR